MGEFEMMSKRLAQTGLYDISEGSGVYAELMSYAVGLDLFFDELEKIKRDIFFDISEGSEVGIYERLMSVCNLDKSAEGRKRSIMSMLSVTDRDFTLEGIKKLLGIYNIDGDVSENGRYININCRSKLSESEEKAINDDIQRFAPLHTKIYVFGASQ